MKSKPKRAPKFKVPRVLVIPRKKWVRSKAWRVAGDSRLLNDQGNRCCAGHFAKACGFSDDEMLDEITLNDLVENVNNYFREIPDKVKNLVLDLDHSEAYDTNDNDDKIEALEKHGLDYVDRKKENALKKLFAQYGIALRFV